MATGGGLIGALRVSLGLDTAQFEAGTKRARGIATRDATAIQKTLSGIKGALGGLLAAATVASIVEAGKRALEYAGSLGEVSQQLGVTTRDLQVFRFIGSQVGVEQDEMDKGLQRLTRSIGEAADGSKKQTTAFRELGVSVKDTNGHVYDAGTVLPKLADALSRITAPATRARIETSLFGKAGQQLDPLLTQGAKGINAMADEAQRLGLILGDDLIKKADDASDRLKVLTQVLEVDIARAVAESADGILVFANAFVSLVAGIGNAISWLKTFGHEARKTMLSMQGYTVFGAPASGDVAARARSKLFFENETSRNQQWAAQDASTTAKKAIIPADGALPTAKGGGGHHAAPKDRSNEITERFDKDLAGLQDDQLQLQQQLTNSIDERAQIEMKRIRVAQDAYNHEVDSRKLQGDFGTDKKLADARAEQLKAAYAANAYAEQSVAWNRANAEKEGEKFDLTNKALDSQEEQLKLDQDEARTQADRRRISLKMLDIDIERQKALVEHLGILYSLNQATEAQVSAAEDTLHDMEQRKGQRAAAIKRETAGPLEDWLNQVPKTAAEFKETMEGIEVRGLDSANDDMASMVTNALKLHGAMGQITEDLIRIVLKMLEAKAINMFAGSKTPEGKASGLADKIGAVVNILGAVLGGGGKADGLGAAIGSKVPGLATGGSFMVNGIGGIDRNVLAINGIPRVRVSDTERVSITPANDRRASGPVEVHLYGDENTFVQRVRVVAADESGKQMRGASKKLGVFQAQRLA